MTTLSPAGLGALIGLIGGLGLLLIVTRLDARRLRLDDRLSPYLRQHESRSGLLRDQVRTPFPTLERILAPVMSDAVRILDRFGSSRADVQRRLIRSGSTMPVEQFRAEQVVWSVLGLVLGLGASILLAASRGSNPVVLVALTVCAGLAGALARDSALTRAAAMREQRLLAELPQVAELLALSVGAGEGALAALERVARTTRGDLAEEIQRTVADTRSGTPLIQALENLADRVELPPLTRFAEAIAVAIERGTPLAEVLRAQAQDVWESGRRALIELGGKKEVGMMVPVVFLILPTTVLFALYPGLIALRM